MCGSMQNIQRNPDYGDLSRRTGGVAGSVPRIMRSPLLAGRGSEKYGLADRQLTGASDRAVDSRVVLVRTNNRLHDFWRRAR